MNTDHVRVADISVLADYSFGPVLITDAELDKPGPTILHVNQALCDLTGYKRDELIGRSPRIFQGPLTDQQTLSDLSNAIRAGKEFEASAINYRKDGTPYLVNWRIWPIQDSDGVIQNFVAVLGDEFGQSQPGSFIGAIAESIESGLIGTDKFGHIIFANQKTFGLTGCVNSSDLFGKPIDELFFVSNPSTHKGDVSAISSLLQKGTPATIDNIELRRLDGSTSNVFLKITPVVIHQDSMIGGIFVMADLMDRSEADKKIGEEKARLENILLGTDAGTWEWNLASDELIVNDRWLSLIGYTREDYPRLTIDDWRKLVHENDIEIANLKLAEHAAGKTPIYEVEFRMRHRDGHWVWLLSRGTIIRSSNHEESKIFAGTHLDITSLKESDAERRAEEEKLRALFDALNDAVFVHPIEPFGYANFIEVNEVACIRYGRSREEMLKLAPADVRDPDARDSLGSKQQLKNLLEKGSVLYETRHFDHDGRSFPVEVSSKLFDYRGTKALMSLVRDITKRKEEEARVLQSMTMFDNSHDGIIITDKYSKIISVNPAFERITGYSLQEALGQTPNFLQSDRQDEKFYQTMWHEIQTKGSWSGQIWSQRKNGKQILEWQTITTLKDESGDVSGYITTFSDITSAKASEEALLYLSRHDPLTGLPNRRQMEEDLRVALTNPQRVAVFYIDLDHLRDINDSFGHSTGDELLVEFAKRLSMVTSETSQLARFSGDEFVIVAPVQNHVDAEAFAKLILESVEKPTDLDGMKVTVTATIGVAIAPEDGGDAPTLLRHAHYALHESKRLGRNTHTVYSPGTPNYSRAKIELETKLREAIEREEFVVCYQPQVDMRSGKVTGYEALVRWRPVGKAQISPGDFIPVAEETGLIVPIGAWVLKQSCLDMMAHKGTRHEPRRVAVNLSGRQLIEKDVVEMVSRTLDETGMPPHCLELEITESYLVSNEKEMKRVMTAFKQLGVRISIDDFGTGQSSLSRLKELPVDKLKIDQSFVRELNLHENDAAIARAIIALSEGLGLEVLAEGVETREQCKFLVNEGCFIGQGFLFSRAKDAQDILSIDHIDSCH